MTFNIAGGNLQWRPSQEQPNIRYINQGKYNSAYSIGFVVVLAKYVDVC